MKIKHLPILIGTFLFLFCTTFVEAKPVSKELAKQVSLQHYKMVSTSAQRFTSSINEVTIISERNNKENVSLFYVCSIKNNGFTIIPADDRIAPILAYSYNGKGLTTLENVPPQLEKILEYYGEVISYVVSQEEPISLTTSQKDWQLILSGKRVESMNSTSNVTTLVQARWDQGDPYNKFCPTHPSNEKAVVGCVATAMAQIMHYHKYPEKGTGFNTFSLQLFGSITANFGNTTYDWSQMPNTLGPNSTQEQINQVATISSHCGVATNMEYNIGANGGSGTYSQLVPDALIKHFGYDKDSTKYLEKSDYNDAQWDVLLRRELVNSRPIYYSGAGAGGGHAFILDGFTGNFYSVNWGWAGQFDGNFLLTNLTPDGTGIGGGAGSYNFGQGAVFIKPPINAGGGGTDPEKTINLELTENIVVNPNPIIANGSVTVTTNIQNKGTLPFNGSISAALFTSTGQFVSYIDVKESQSLVAGASFTQPIELTKNSLFGIAPGDYKVALYYKTSTQDWKSITSSVYTPVVNVSIIAAASDDILTLYGGEIEVPNIVELNSPFEVKLNLKNTSLLPFTGDFSVDLMDSEGNYIEELSKFEGVTLPPDYIYDEKLTFNVAGISGSEPGIYYIAAWFKSENADWKLVSGGQYTNPKEFSLVAQGLLADIYEPNNIIDESKEITLTNNGNCIFNGQSSDANLHNNTDVDIYSINLPNTCPYYKVTITVQDRDNDAQYSGDVIFTHSLSSDVFDLMPAEVIVSAGSQLTFKVEPYFPGQTGTYITKIDIEPSATSSVTETEKHWTITPNPSSIITTIQSNNGSTIKQLVVRDYTGKEVTTLHYSTVVGTVQLNTSLYPTGQYYIDIITNLNETQRLILNVVR